MYKIEIQWGGQSDEAMLEVMTDPRIDVDMAGMQEVYNAQVELRKFTQLSADAVKQLVEAKNTAEDIRKRLKKKDKEKYKEEMKASNEQVRRINELIALYIGKEDKRQGIIRNKEMTVIKRIQTAQRYVNTRQQGLSSTENDLIRYAKRDLEKAVEFTNDYFNTEWSEYHQKIEALDFSPFKEVKTFELE